MDRNRGVLAVISGFSGVGKGTLVKLLLERYDNYALSVSATTRSPRPGEEEGKSYFFLTREEFEKRISQDYWRTRSTANGNGDRHCVKHHLSNQMKNIWGRVPSGFHYCA